MSPPRASHDNHKEKGGVVAPTLSNDERPQQRRDTPSTLTEAHDVLWRQRPARDADPQEWVKFHRHSARVYAQAAEADPQHRHEALQCGAVEILKARTIEHRLNPELDGDDT